MNNTQSEILRGCGDSFSVIPYYEKYFIKINYKTQMLLKKEKINIIYSDLLNAINT